MLFIQSIMGAWYELQGERDKRVTKGYDFLDRSLV